LQRSSILYESLCKIEGLKEAMQTCSLKPEERLSREPTKRAHEKNKLKPSIAFPENHL
jgi:hypothetical protein